MYHCNENANIVIIFNDYIRVLILMFNSQHDYKNNIENAL